MGTPGYNAVESFDWVEFWRVVQGWSENGALVLVSEYSAPPGWRVVWEKAVKADMHGAGREGRAEKLFEWGTP